MKKQIVFFCATTPYVEIYKIAREFKEMGYETVLITISQKDKWDEEFYKDAFNKIICSNFQVFKLTPNNLLNMAKRLPYLIKSIYEMKKLRPYVIFDIARPNYIAAIFMKFFKKYPIIYLPADISSHLHPTTEDAIKAGKKSYEIKAERYCFENADGILIKASPNSLDHLTKESMLGPPLKLTKNIICFNPYCSDEFIVPINKDKLSKKDGDFHIIYAGSIYGGPEDMKFFINLFEKFISQKMHLHLYIKTHHLSKEDDEKIVSPLTSYFNNSPYLHLQYAVPPKELIAEISSYDFGLWMDRLRGDKDQEHKFTMGNKFASYLEAGIPFLYTSSFKFIDSLAKDYGLNFSINTENLDSLDGLKKRLKKLNYDKVEKDIIKARKDFNMKRHMPRLEKFIETVNKKKYNNTYK
jgi:hypothetical protein